MTTKSKTQIMSHDDTVMSPITKASNVLFEDGETAQDKLEDNVEKSFTPSVENSSSMFKVGQGDNVDYSGNVVDGAYVSCVLKGKTMVNCIQESSSQDVILPYEFTEGQYVTINDTKESGALGVELKGQTLVNLMKSHPHGCNYDSETGIYTSTKNEWVEPVSTDYSIKVNTPYTLFAKVNTTASQLYIRLDYKGGTVANDSIINGDVTPNKDILIKMVVNFKKEDKIRFVLRNASGGIVKMSEIILIEGDYTNIDIPYFTGMASVKAPTVKTVGKNLFDGKIKNNTNINGNTGEEGEDGLRRTISVNFTKVKPGTQYMLTRPVQQGNVGARYYDINCKFLSAQNLQWEKSVAFTTPTNCFYFKFIDEANALQECYQIEEGSTATAYEAYQTSSVTLPEEVILRSLPNGVCDTYNTRTGEYVQRVKEIVLDGSDDEQWAKNTQLSNDTFTVLHNVGYTDMKRDTVMTNIFCNKLIALDYTVAKEECVGRYPSGREIVVKLSNSKLSTLNSAGLRKWLKQNPITVQYELATPIIANIKDIEPALPNKVKNEFDRKTGNYTKKIGRTILDGSEKWVGSLHSTNGEYYASYFQLNGMKRYKIGEDVSLKSDVFPAISPVHDTLAKETNSEFIATYGSSVGTDKENWLYLSIRASKLSPASPEGLKRYLKQNPVTVWYELAEPITMETPKSWNTTTHIYSEIPENSPYPILSHSNPTYPVILKPSTEYSIVANSYSNNHSNSAINFNLGGATASTTVGSRITTVTTPNTLSNNLLTMNGRCNKLNNIMVIEGEVVGDEPYFEGICDVKSPVVKNVGKNLFDGFKKGNINSNGLPVWNITENNVLSELIRVDGTKQYTVSNFGTLNALFCCKYDENKNYLGAVVNTPTASFGENVKFIRIQINNPSKTIEELNETLQLEQSTQATTYEPHKSNMTTFNQKDDKTIVLRSLPNGVCDTLNVETGEYVRRIGEVVLNGSEGWSRQYSEATPLMSCNIEDLIVKEHKMWCDKLQNISIYSSNANMGICSITGGSKGSLRVRTPLVLNGQTVTDFKAWLQANPITVQYELATPIISTIDVQGFPYAYKDGHVQLSSSHTSQSLTPKVEYSLPINRNGQIRMNQVMVEKHQKHIDKLQAMIITNMVNTQYRQSLTKINYQLGGEQVWIM